MENFMKLSLLIITALITISKCSTFKAPVKIAAFNVQVLGQTKISKTNVVKILVKIINRYDIILIQEIRDSRLNKNAMDILLQKVNRYAKKNGTGKYAMVISKRLGRTISKEQYAFLYRKNIAKVLAFHTYLDSKDDFEREPFAVYFRLQSAAVKDIVFIGVHAKPDDAANEVDKLVDVYDYFMKRWRSPNVIIMGDFNAACDYVRDRDWPNIRLATDQRFWWLIDDSEDTTVQGSRCAYDRVISNFNLLKDIVGESVGVFNFTSFYNLDINKAKMISDHYPVEFQIKGKGWRQQKRLDFVLSSSEIQNITEKQIYDKISNSRSDFIESKLYKNDSETAQIKLTTEIFYDINSTIQMVYIIYKQFKAVMGDIQPWFVENHFKKLKRDSERFPYQVFTKFQNEINVNITINLVWKFNAKISCDMVISKTFKNTWNIISVN